MTRRLNLPDTASVATPQQDGRLFAPSAARNADAIADLVREVAPSRGRALELASGTGQHVAMLAARHPGLTWQPSDADPARLPSIAAWCGAADLANVLEPALIDATEPGWHERHPAADLVLLVNLLHLIGTQEARILLTGVTGLLAPGGCFILYGPFMRDGRLTSAGDAAFHASLIEQDPEIGYKNAEDVVALIAQAGCVVTHRREMPANNLALVARRPD